MKGRSRQVHSKSCIRELRILQESCYVGSTEPILIRKVDPPGVVHDNEEPAAASAATGSATHPRNSICSPIVSAGPRFRQPAAASLTATKSMLPSAGSVMFGRLSRACWSRGGATVLSVPDAFCDR